MNGEMYHARIPFVTSMYPETYPGALDKCMSTDILLQVDVYPVYTSIHLKLRVSILSFSRALLP